jgi:hypothetical protein
MDDGFSSVGLFSLPFLVLTLSICLFVVFISRFLCVYLNKHHSRTLDLNKMSQNDENDSMGEKMVFCGPKKTMMPIESP